MKSTITLTVKAPSPESPEMETRILQAAFEAANKAMQEHGTDSWGRLDVDGIEVTYNFKIS